MINNYDELLKALENIDCGSCKFTLQVRPTRVDFEADDFVGRAALRGSSYWLDNIMYHNVSRNFSKSDKKWYVPVSARNRIIASIHHETLVTISKCSDAKEPKRTDLYKSFKALSSSKVDDAEYLSSIIAIINYYNSAETDPTCKKNVLGLFLILRKKYGIKSRDDI